MPVHDVLSQPEFYTRLINPSYKSGTVVMYTARWCGPCQAIKPYFEELSNIFTTTQFLKVDVDQLSELSLSANVRGMPTFTYYKNSQRVKEIVGADRKGLYDMILSFYQA